MVEITKEETEAAIIETEAMIGVLIETDSRETGIEEVIDRGLLEEMKEGNKKKTLTIKSVEILKRCDAAILKKPKRWKFSCKSKLYLTKKKNSLKKLNKNSKRHVSYPLLLEK
jgi:hypothetical protein